MLCIKSAYKAKTLPTLSNSEHLAVHLLDIYKS